MDKGPKAPKDPVSKRNGFYIMVDTIVEATERQKTRPSQEIYLDDGRLINKAQIVGGIEDENILELLKDCKGFRQLVHSIGVSVTASKDTKSIEFVFHNYGETNKYDGGTMIRIPCSNNGEEIIIPLGDINWSEDDNIPGKLAFEFLNPGESAKVSVKLYLHDGYKVPEFNIDPPIDFEDFQYKEMITKSLMNMGNNLRLKRAIKKAKKGEDLTIAYIGGSITQGAGAKPIHTNSYAYRSYLSFKKIFEKEGANNVHFLKAGVGGTPSELGMIRYERDVLRDGTVSPDIVIVEFGVNDDGDETKGECYESLVLKILNAPNKPAVILLFSVFANDWNLQERLSPVGKLYNLPIVSVLDAVVEQFSLKRGEGNVITKRQYFYDTYHPTNDGHRIMADCLTYLFKRVDETKLDEQDIIIDKNPVIGNAFIEVKLLDRKDFTKDIEINSGSFSDVDKELQMVEIDKEPKPVPQFPYNWMHTPATGTDSFRMKIKSKNLLLIYKDSGREDFGKADIYVDGKLVLTANPHINGWTHCNTVILYKEDISKEHMIEIKMTKGNENKYFTILGFGYTL
ncbi:MAG: SGNH/GDSL hydrolase family protein [Epulopiscium sp.]|nr:SGNH/GDSL hydrolase family protein [Candidatus Epulonipiscium sp.]